jgi:hypothetical protein
VRPNDLAPPPSPFSLQQVVSISQSSCVSLVELTYSLIESIAATSPILLYLVPFLLARRYTYMYIYCMFTCICKLRA